MASESGGCLCGKVRFTAQDVERHFHACHCGMCRRWAGGPLFGTMAGEVAFENEDQITVFSSSEWAERGFCKSCGTNLFYRLKSGGYFMCVGAFDEGASFKLAGEIYVDHQPDGYRFAGDQPRLTEAEALAQFGAES